MSSMRTYLFWPIVVTIVGLAAVFVIGLRTEDSISGALSFFLIGAVLAVLEISLSFDNAIVNANKLKYMTPVWQRRFLTWGILIAVFGMRVIFPIVIVAVAAKLGPIAAVELAIFEPDQYSYMINESHVSISAFGGAFLMMVALGFFCDAEKDVDWFKIIEARLRKWGALKGLEIAMVLLVIIGISRFLSPTMQTEFLFAAILGLFTFLMVDLLGKILDSTQDATDIARSGALGAFLYLEVLDASFSFDGVIGAFALTKNLFLIAIGLGIGAMYVRAMTVMLVEKGTLSEFRYLEHGAFYSIFMLSMVMFSQSIMHIPEVITGLLSVMFIALALFASLRYNKKHKEA